MIYCNAKMSLKYNSRNLKIHSMKMFRIQSDPVQFEDLLNLNTAYRYVFTHRTTEKNTLV